MDPLTEAKNHIVRRWGELGGYWGISRTMAELHALLFVTRASLCTDDIMTQLQISRGNASMNLRALVDWGLIQRVHRFGDRKEYFVAQTDIWKMFETIMRERSRREVEPIMTTLDRCVALVDPARAGLEGDPAEDAAAFVERVREMRSFLETMSKLFELLLQLGPDGFHSLASMMSAGQDSSAASPVQAARTSRRRPSASRR